MVFEGKAAAGGASTTTPKRRTAFRDCVVSSPLKTPRMMACRNLFGRADREENVRFLANFREELEEQANIRWNFDFRAGEPLPGNYEWNRTDVTSVSQPPSSSSEDIIQPVNITNSSGHRVSGTRGVEVDGNVVEINDPETVLLYARSPSPTNLISFKDEKQPDDSQTKYRPRPLTWAPKKNRVPAASMPRRKRTTSTTITDFFPAKKPRWFNARKQLRF